MRDPKRIPKVLKEIQEIWETCPDLRLGQLLGNVFGQEQYIVEDDDVITYLRKFYRLKEKKLDFKIFEGKDWR